MSFRPICVAGVAILALGLMTGCGQPAAHTDSVRPVAAVAPVQHQANAAAAVRSSIATTEERLDPESSERDSSGTTTPAKPAAGAHHDADDHDAVTAPRVFPAAGTPCADALRALRGVVAFDRMEDQTEAANSATDATEDQGEAATLRASLQAAAKACLPAQLSSCTLATNALTAINARQALKDAAEAAHPLPAALAQFEDQAEARILTAAQNAVTAACAA